jgi:tetratricopeptide (TPR) repeat protein
LTGEHIDQPNPAKTRPVLLLATIALCLLAAACARGSEQALKHAADAWDSGDYEGAAEEYERYLEQDPSGEGSPEARFQLANIYYLNLHRYDQARAHYSTFLNSAPSHPNAAVARERLAEVLAELGRSYEAISELENIHSFDAYERRRIRLRIAELYYEQKNYNQALTEYEKVSGEGEYDELAEQAYQRQASIYHIARRQYQQALPAYQKLASLTSNPETRRRAIYGIVECYAGLYQFDDAIRALREVKEEGEQGYVARRISELEQQKREAAEARSAVQQR